MTDISDIFFSGLFVAGLAIFFGTLGAEVALTLWKERNRKFGSLRALKLEAVMNKELIVKSTWQPLLEVAYERASLNGVLLTFSTGFQRSLVRCYAAIVHRNYLISLFTAHLSQEGEIMVYDAEGKNPKLLRQVIADQRPEIEKQVNSTLRQINKALDP